MWGKLFTRSPRKASLPAEPQGEALTGEPGEEALELLGKIFEAHDGLLDDEREWTLALARRFPEVLPELLSLKRSLIPRVSEILRQGTPQEVETLGMARFLVASFARPSPKPLKLTWGEKALVKRNQRGRRDLAPREEPHEFLEGLHEPQELKRILLARVAEGDIWQWRERRAFRDFCIFLIRGLEDYPLQEVNLLPFARACRDAIYITRPLKVTNDLAGSAYSFHLLKRLPPGEALRIALALMEEGPLVGLSVAALEAYVAAPEAVAGYPMSWWPGLLEVSQAEGVLSRATGKT